MYEIQMRSDDLMKTSTGVGHKWRQNPSHPDGNIMTSLTKPLPEALSKLPDVTPAEHYQTVTRSAHDHKMFMQNYGQAGPFFNKPPAHYRVHYNRDLHEKLQSERPRRALTMGNQLSEMKEEYSLRQKQFEPERFVDLQGFSLKDHLKEPSYDSGPEKIGLPSVSGQPVHNSVYLLNDPYVTTYQKNHRAYKPNEIDPNPKFLVDPVMVAPQETPMRDRSFFKSATRINRMPPIVNPVPHSGLKSEYRENYGMPAELNKCETSVCPINPNLLLTKSEPSSSVYSVPQLYRTEYKNVGSKCRIIV